MPDTDPAQDHAGPAASPGSDREQAAELDEAARRAPLHRGDQAPRFVLRGQAWLHRWLSNESRLVLGLVIVILAVFAAVVLSSTRLLRVFFDGLDVLALLGLFLVNWLGNGGALVPIPGARFIGLLLIFQQAAVLPSWEVFGVAGAAMALGLLSYYIAGARTAQAYAEGDSAGAEELAQQTGMLDDEQIEFSPGAELDARAVSAIAGVDQPAATDPAESEEGDPRRLGRLRRRFRTSLRQAQQRAQPIIDQRGITGMFLLCFAPTPMGTASAYVGGLMRFGFARYLAASFGAKYLLAGVVVLLALTFSGAAESVQIPELHIPVINVTLFEDGPPGLPTPAPSPTVPSD